MQIKKIHSMQWATNDKSFVLLFADTNEGDNQEIATPYNDTSIIWDDVKAYPTADIAEYVERVQPVEDTESTEVV